MLTDLAEGYRDAVIVYNMDRLTRQPMELEQFTRLCEQAGVTQVKSVTADIDLGNDDGLFMARILAAIASKESGRKSQRLQRKARQLAEQGLPNGGHHRPFGYEQDRMTVNEAEAEILRQAVARFLAGESSRSICSWLNEEGVQTTAGGSWQTMTLNALLKSARSLGCGSTKASWLRTLNGQESLHLNSGSRSSPASKPRNARTPARRAATCCRACCAAENAETSCSPPSARKPAAMSASQVLTTVAAEASRSWPRRWKSFLPLPYLCALTHRR
ncbi:hypothetical protein ARTHRO9AX_270002 [Arthrobacter sp. 9AX]|nr:hypothetical protein ARTHRO9AX_270002 [Arthrobacter sp. 9AX]